MTCEICKLPDAQRKLLEQRIDRGIPIDQVGVEFRLDYDVISNHIDNHRKEPRDHATRTEETLQELEDVIEAARLLSETEESAVNYTAYANLVKVYNAISQQHDESLRIAREESRKAEVLYDTVVGQVVNPMLTDTVRIISQELVHLRSELQKANPHVDYTPYFDDAIRRTGSILQDSVTSYMDTLKSAVGMVDVKPTKRK